MKKVDHVTSLVRGTFELTPSDVKKLKMVAEEASRLNNENLKVSTFSVTCAYLLDCLVKAEETKQDKLLFIFAVECRSRLDPPIPVTYIGNCVAGAKALVETKRLLENDGFIATLEAISEALKRFEDGGLSGVETWISEILK